MPKTLEELSAVLALARPGALAFVDQYASYSNNGVKESIHPFFDDILVFIFIVIYFSNLFYGKGL